MRESGLPVCGLQLFSQARRTKPHSLQLQLQLCGGFLCVCQTGEEMPLPAASVDQCRKGSQQNCPNRRRHPHEG